MKQKLSLLFIILLAAVLRLYALDKFPVGLNADEAAIGYNTYSLLETGKDEHGVSWPLVFRSFDDYKPPLYFYLSLPFIKTLGLNIWAVRLPSALLGVGSVYLIYLLVNQLFQAKDSPASGLGRQRRTTPGVARAGLLMWNPSIGFLAALLLAISPWHIHFSRGAWESNAAAFFLLLAVWSFLKSLKIPKYFYLSSFSFLASIYTYHSMRLVSPLLFFSLLTIYWPELGPLIKPKKPNKHLVLSLILGLFLLLPIAKQMLGSEGTSRFSGVSIFSDQGPLWEALERRRQSVSPNSIQTRLIHNKYLSYTKRFLANYLSHYSPRFLFITGDEIGRNKVPEMGQSYIILAPFYLLGILYLLKLDTKGKKLVLSWFLLAPLAAAFTFQSPHALRSQNMTIPFAVITALGIHQFFTWLNQKTSSWRKASSPGRDLLLPGALAILLTYSTARYLHQYYIHYPKELPTTWQYGFSQVASFVKKHQDRYDSIIISNRYDQPYIIMAFFLKYPPDKFQEEIKLEPRDKFGFSTVNSFGKFKFKKINWEKDKKQKNTLIITAGEWVDPKTKPIYQVYFPNSQPAFNFYSTSNGTDIDSAPSAE